MKKWIVFLILAALLLTLSCPVYASDFELDDKAVINGMDGISWYQGYTPTVKRDMLTICLPVRSETAAGKITASLTLDDPNLLLFRGQPGTVTVSARNGMYPVKITVPLSQNRRNGDYPAKILITGKNENGAEISETIPYVLRIRDGQENPETVCPEITASGELTVGQECILRLTVSNPTTALSMTDCVLTVTDAAGEVLMSGSNRLSFGEVLPGENANVEVPVTVKGKAAVELHSLSLKLTYQVLGEEKTWEETIAYPVTQEIRLEQGEITMPSSTIQGELTTLSVPLMNMGKGDICNAMVSLEIPELIQRQSVLVGTIEPGSTGQAKLSFTPPKDALGDFSGRVTFSCEDAYGNGEQWEVPVDITVEAAKPMEAGKTQEKKETPAWLLPGVCVLCVLLLVGMLVQGSLLRSKLHKLEEERL